MSRAAQALKDLVWWHSVDREGERAFHVRNKGGEGAFLFHGARKRGLNARTPGQEGQLSELNNCGMKGRERERKKPSSLLIRAH